MNQDISEERIRVFTNAVKHYFAQVAGEAVAIDTAFLAEDGNPVCYDYTGLISVSGDFRGCVYFSAPRVMLRHLLIAHGESDHREEHLLDLVGEVANTFSGNAREYFGPSFAISPPLAVSGRPDCLDYHEVHERPFVISITWKAYTAAIAVCVEGGRSR
jgi:chemotaxis protein CheX